MNGQRNALIFEWFNEPAAGHVSGGSLDKELKGTWSKQFHAFCSYLLMGSHGINFQGYPVVGPTLSFFGEPGAEQQELATLVGGQENLWWEKMQRRCVNIGVYLPKQARSPEDAASMHRVELERILGKMIELPISPSNHRVRIHEWYVSKPMPGYKMGECDDSFRAECIHAIGESIASFKVVEAAFFFTHYYPSHQVKTPYDEHSAFSGPCRTAMIRFLKGST